MKKETITIEELQKIIDDKNKENATLKDTIISLEKQISTLHEKIDFLLRQRFQSKSEKLNPNQPSLFDDAPEETTRPPIEDDTERIEYTRKKEEEESPRKICHAYASNTTSMKPISCAAVDARCTESKS